MTEPTAPLSPRHARFVQEFLRDGNATQAYLRAGYAPRGAQPSASRLMRRPDVAAAIAAGRQRLGRAADLSVERLAQEYARIAFASVDDFITVDADGGVRLDLAKASAAERAGIVELKIRTHSKQEQQITLKLGKLQALAALTKQMGVLVEAPEPGLTAEDRERYERRCAGYQRVLDHSNQERWRLERELREARAALERLEEIPRCARDDEGVERAPAAVERTQLRHSERSEESPATGTPFEEIPRCARNDGEVETQQPAVEPGMPTGPGPDHTPGLYPNAKFTWSGGRDLHMGLDSAEALRRMKSSFPGR